jgi:cytochrome c oxidase subunit 2
MPIAVRVMSEQNYAAWLEQAKKKFATDDSRPTSVAAAETGR